MVLLVSGFGDVAPELPGDYVLRITLVPERVRWFDDVDAAYDWTTRIRVG
jgi:hypothetical protein